jgi:hypothetical protein
MNFATRSMRNRTELTFQVVIFNVMLTSTLHKSYVRLRGNSRRTAWLWAIKNQNPVRKDPV